MTEKLNPGRSSDSDRVDIDCDSADAGQRKILGQLRQTRVRAPDDLTRRVMAALPPATGAARRPVLWRPRWEARWWVPAGAGAVAALVLALGVSHLLGPAPGQTMAVRFEVHAPGATQVELVGTFNSWRPGEVLLLGPDASGHWSATVEIPAGRHEYLFLVDGKEWLTDRNAEAHRPDGFGRENALLAL